MKIPMHLISTVAAITLASLVGAGQYAAVLLIVVWCSREVTQAEYRWIEKYGKGKRANMPWWGGFDPKAWTFDSFVVDMLLPVLFCLPYLTVSEII